ncbi:hypothetical protein AB0C34_21860 [Nocardia sp. NPDC049220]|uniref:hypothetical protein n=1 Tax=Nocardia sp. NPDC049220 TaxID=3155273 RepID=UPI0034082532
MERTLIMAPPVSHPTAPKPFGLTLTAISESIVIWPDPSPLDAWWRHVMHIDRPRRAVA